VSVSRPQGRGLTKNKKLAALARFAAPLGAPQFRCAGTAGENNYSEELGLEFIAAATRAGWIVPFGWATWSQTAEGQRLLGEPRHMATATAEQLGKVLTTLIRGERFSEGTLSGAFESGLLLAIAQRAQALLDVHKTEGAL